MGWADKLTEESVVDAESFCYYVQQELGVNNPTKAVVTSVDKLYTKMTQGWPTIAGYVGVCKLVRPRPETAIAALKVIKSLTPAEG